MKRIQLNGYEIYVDKNGIMHDDEGNSYYPPSGVKVSTGSYSGSKAKRIVSKYSKGEKRPPTARGGPTAAQVKASEIQARMNTYGAIWFWLERIKKHIGKEASSKDISFLDKVTKIAKNASEARGGKLTKQHKKGIISIHNKYKKLIPSSDSLKRWDSYLTVERKNNMKKSELRKIIIEEIENIVKAKFGLMIVLITALTEKSQEEEALGPLLFLIL